MGIQWENSSNKGTFQNSIAIHRIWDIYKYNQFLFPVQWGSLGKCVSCPLVKNMGPLIVEHSHNVDFLAFFSMLWEIHGKIHVVQMWCSIVNDKNLMKE